jgi:hypothetical protein
MDLELIEIRTRMEQMALKMQPQEENVHWRYEWSLSRKVKWPIQKLLARKKQVMRKWMRHAENLDDIEEKVIHICVPDIGRKFSDEEEVRSVKGILNCQEGSDEISYCHVGNEMRLVDLIDYQMGRK